MCDEARDETRAQSHASNHQVCKAHNNSKYQNISGNLLFCISPKRINALPIISSVNIWGRLPTYNVATISLAVKKEGEQCNYDACDQHVLLDGNEIPQGGTVDSGYSHTKCFQEKCDYKRSVTLSGVTQNSSINTRKSIFIA